MTTRINIDVKFKTPEAAALGFGLLYHAAGVVQSGCRQQLIAGMADEPTAENFIAHALRDDRVREAAIGLAGRIMEDSLRALASGLELGEEAAPIALDREPAQIVHDGLAEILARDWVPSLDLVRSWSMDMLESASAWILAVHEERRHGRPDPTIPRTLAEALSLDAGDVARNELPVRSRLATPDASSSQVSNAALPTAETSTPGADPGATPPPTVGSEDALFESLSTSGAEGWGIEEIEADFEREPLGYFSTEGEERVRLVVDGVTMWASTVTVECIEVQPAIGPDDFTIDNDAIEFFADGEYNTTTVERLRLRIESRDEEGGCDFTLYADGELHDGCSSLTEVANSYPNVAPTIDAWKAGRTVPFAVVVTAARKLAGLTEPLPEENQ